MLALSLEELVTPVTEALVAVGGLLVVGSGEVLYPFNEQVLVLFEEEELTEDNVGLVKSLALEPLAEHLADASQVSHRFLAHGLRHEVPVLLGCGGHVVLLCRSLVEVNQAIFCLVV